MRLSTLAVFAAVLALAAPAAAQCTGTAGTDFQDVTIRDINMLPAGNVDALVAGGASLEIADIQALTAPALLGERVQFTAVLLTDPFKSGIRSLNGQGIPGGVHTFMRDVAAASDGVEGMGTQVIDFSGSGTLQAFFPGDELVICGEVQVFTGSGGSSSQLAVESATATGTVYGPEDPLMQPVVVTSGDVHNTFNVDGEIKSQIDWARYEEFNGQFVRFEEIELLQGVNDGDRPNLLLSTPGEDAQINTYDTSVCFRNDRGPEYFPTAGSAPDCIDEPFVAPASGIVNVQGFLSFQGDDGNFNYAVPRGANFVVNPFEESDFEIAFAAPIVAVDDLGLTRPGDFVVTTTIVPGTPGNTIASAQLTYSVSSGATGTVDLTNTSGDVYEGTIPGLVAGDFVTFSVTATDSQNSASLPTDAITRLVVEGAIDSIFQVQATVDGGEGDSGVTTREAVAFDLDAVVQTAYASSNSTPRFQATIQDDPSLGPFSGVLIDFGTSEDPGLTVGDRITITSARVTEFSGATQLTDVDFTVTGSGEPYAAKVVTTGLFSGDDGAAAAEQHEGILVRVENASIADVNPDAPNNFGEFAIASDGEDELRVDDTAAEVAGINGDVVVGQEVTVEGYLTTSFGNTKIALVDADAIVLGPVSREGDLATGAVRIVGAFPNPAAGTARVRFALATTADVSLRVFDTTGRQVMTLADGARTAGSHDVSADLSGLASGVYVLRLVADGDVATARMAVVR
ncbi:T9SS type A sorting domain-containing protein [Rubrivirga sp. IMCC45206]|uniref:T9SS type A sorting domain-containing protein n=1 Tax=Rubrivirga sp. IMCC45206 TaxID=3391614 RepID=UPI00398FBF55